MASTTSTGDAWSRSSEAHELAERASKRARGLTARAAVEAQALAAMAAVHAEELATQAILTLDLARSAESMQLWALADEVRYLRVADGDASHASSGAGGLPLRAYLPGDARVMWPTGPFAALGACAALQCNLLPLLLP